MPNFPAKAEHVSEQLDIGALERSLLAGQQYAKRLFHHSAKEAFTVAALLRGEQLITEEMPQGPFCLSCFSTAQSTQ